MTRALVIQTSFLGDMVLTTPLLSALAKRGPVDVVATPANAGLLSHHPAVRTVYTYDKRGAQAGISGFRAMVRQVRAQARTDVAYLAQGSWRSAALALAAGFRRRVGFDTSAGRPLYTTTVPYQRDRHHAVRLWQLSIDRVDATTGAEPDAAELRPRVYPGNDEEAAVDQLLREHGYSGQPLIALAPGSVWATKRWPYYVELATRLSGGFRVVVVGGRDDTPLAASIVRATAGRAIDATGRLSLLASACLLGRTSVLVTNDSAPLHLASAMNTPTIALFGPTVPGLGFGPLANGSSIAQADTVACRPCDAHGPQACPLVHWRCMRDLTISHVLDVVQQVRPNLMLPL